MDIFCGVDLGGTKIETIACDADMTILGQARRPTPEKGGPQDVADAISGAIGEACKAAGDVTLKGVGIGSPGEVDGEQGTVTGARNLPGWEGTFALATAVSDAVGAPVKLGNDVQTAVNAEATIGTGKDYNSFIGVFWGTGVGGGIILDRKPWLGRDAAGEIGHMVVKVNGARCGCGRRGCMEAYAGRHSMEVKARKQHEKGHKTGLIKIAEEKGKDRFTSAVWHAAVKRDDKLAVRLIDRAVKMLGVGIASAVNLLDVEAVIIGGGLGTRFGEPYVKRIAQAMQPHLFADSRPPDVKLVGLDDLSGGYGGVLMAKEVAA